MTHSNCYVKASSPLKAQAGIALIQVLLLTAVLLLMALQFTFSSRQQIMISSDMHDKFMAEVQLRTLESRLLFSLLTQSKADQVDHIKDKDNFSVKWNFFGKPFTPYERAEVSIQGLNNFISIFNNTNIDLLHDLIEATGKSNGETNDIVFQIQQWQGNLGGQNRQKNSLLREDFANSLQELQLLPSIDNKLMKYLSRHITIYPTPYINIMLAPKAILKLYVNDDIANELVSLRNNGELTRQRFIELTRIFEDETISFTPSKRMKLKLSITYNNVVVTKEMICYIRPENSFRIIWFNQ